MSRHPARQALAREFGATDVATERGDEGYGAMDERRAIKTLLKP